MPCRRRLLGPFVVAAWLGLAFIWAHAISNDLSSNDLSSNDAGVPTRLDAAPHLVGRTTPVSVAITTDEPDFLRDIQPILNQHCLACHGPERDASGLRVDRWQILLEGGEYGVPAVVPGEPTASFLLQVVDGSSEDLSMPPEGHPPLTPAQVDLLRRWIAAGATVPLEFAEAVGEDPRQWWSLQPIAPSDGADPERAIDSWIEVGLRSQGLDFSPAADRVSLIRRLYLVMLGLPPTPAEVQAFVADSDPRAWERLVDRVLASPHYGERWARHWLDVVRFGETDGYETNQQRPNAWRYRDWVIDAFNRDMPYDDFVRYQIAGDVLGEPIGTSFLVGGPHDIVKSPDRLLTLTQRQDELTDMVATVGTAFLGLTIGCARCHNHKFDPIPQTDFHAMQAVFAGVRHGESVLPPAEDTSEARRALDEAWGQWRQDLLAHVATLDPATIVWPAVDATFNLEVFPPTQARLVRFTILATNASEPCLDELEIFSGGQSVGLASQGTRVTSSGDYAGNPKHRLEHLNDGRFGNDYSWISDSDGRGWVQLEWDHAQQIDRIQWSRDRSGGFADRLATDYRIEVSVDGQAWSTVASSAGRLPMGSDRPSLYEAADIGSRLRTLRQQYQALTRPTAAFCGSFGPPETIYKLFRGDPLSPQEEVGPENLSLFQGLDLPANASDSERRLALANALVRPDNPLLARVIVNRLWQYHFGTGLVETASDFGRNAARPSHPELLDSLAARLIQHNWSLKQLQREILLSRTWQQSSLPRAEALQVDAGSRLLWRFPPRRLEAEIIRDQILALSGDLQHVGGGPGFSAFVVEKETVHHYHPVEDFQPEHFRRMVYQTKIRQEQDAVFGAFDCPDGTQIAPQRSRSTTPLQALNLFNSGFVQQQAERFAARLQSLVATKIDAEGSCDTRDDTDANTDAEIAIAFQFCFGREPSPEEWLEVREFVAEQGLPALCRVLLNSNELLFIP